MRLGRKIWVVLALIMTGMLGVLGTSVDVQALDKNEILKKWVFVGYMDCIGNGHMNTTLSNISPPSSSVAASVMKQDGSRIYLPSYNFISSAGSESLSCYDIFMGSSGVEGVANRVGINKSVTWSDTSGTNAILVDKLGYDFHQNQNGRKYFNISATGSWQSCTLQGVCMGGLQELPVTSARVTARSDGGYDLDTQDLNSIHLNISNNAKKMTISLGSGCVFTSQNKQNPFPITVDFGNNFDDFVKNINVALDGVSVSYECNDAQVRNKRSVTFGTEVANAGAEGTYTYPIGSDEAGAYLKDTVRKLSGADAFKDLNLDINQRYVLYQYYINQAGRVDCENAHDDAVNWVEIKNWRVDGEFKTCYANFNREDPMNIMVSDLTTSDGYLLIADQTPLAMIISWMNRVDTSKLTDVDVVTDGGVTSDNGVDPCWNAGIESQSWFLCPTLNNLTYTAGPLEGMIEDWLAVDPNLYDFDSPTYTVWEVMRNIANTVMIVFLLVVIFSQLTGYGIDNYGIKKMLPRLLVMAILINLSFVICEVAVDLSNILGSALRDMFGSIGEGLLNSRNMESYLEEFIGTVVTWLLVAATAGGAVSGTVLTIVGVSGDGVMVAVVLILALVVVLAALLLFFVMLGARMIIVIGCVAVAPIAFALFILPNTQNWFKRWWSLFKAGLIIFPICGAVAGVSVLIKGIVLSTDEIQMWMLVVALIAPFLPFFLLPTLLKETIAGLGKIGGALTSMGERFTGGVRGVSDAVRGSNRYQEAAQYGKDLTAAERARRVQQGLRGRVQNGNASEREMRRYAQAAHRISTYESGREKMYGEIFDRNNRSDNEQEFIKSLTSNDAERSSAALSALLAQGGIDEALKAASGANWNTMDTNVKNRLLQTMAASNVDAFKSFSKYKQTGGAAGFQEWADGSYVGPEQAGVKDRTYAQHLAENGVHALDNYSKDEMNFVGQNAAAIGGELGSKFSTMLSSATVNSKDAKAQTVAENTIANGIASGNIDIDDLGLTPEMLGSMRGETAEAIKRGYVDLWRRTTPGISDADAEAHAVNYIRSNRGLVDAANNDEQIRNRMNQEVKDLFGIS
ncbi:hypothetical protein IKG05_01130 [Candidatus Saccharibacteria bacterium]|nr:hypothetical protein [Candidatus Saccharibacteria bacterium]